MNTAGGERNPVVSVDETTIYFASGRDGGKGGSDIWKATRASKNDPFAAAKNVAELNSSDGEYPTWLSPDGCRLYFDRLVRPTRFVRHAL